RPPVPSTALSDRSRPLESRRRGRLHPAPRGAPAPTKETRTLRGTAQRHRASFRAPPDGSGGLSRSRQRPGGPFRRRVSRAASSPPPSLTRSSRGTGREQKRRTRCLRAGRRGPRRNPSNPTMRGGPGRPVRCLSSGRTRIQGPCLRGSSVQSFPCSHIDQEEGAPESAGALKRLLKRPVDPLEETFRNVLSQASETRTSRPFVESWSSRSRGADLAREILRRPRVA